MPSAAELFVRVGVSGMDDVVRQFAVMDRQIGSFGASGQSAGARFASGIASGVATAAKAIAGLTVGGVLATAAGLGFAAKQGLAFNNSMEQVSARLNAFTGDANETARLLGVIENRAKLTPFAFEDMAGAMAGLLPVAKQAQRPIEDLIGTAEILAASNPAQGLEGAVLALQNAAGGDFASLADRFNLPLQVFNKYKKEGLPPLEAVSRGLQDLGLNSRLVENLGKTMSGRLSTVKDTLVGIAATATAQVFDRLSSSLGRLQGVIDANMPALDAFASAVGDRLGQAFDYLLNTGVPAAIAGLQQLGAFWGTVAEAFNAGGILAAYEAIFGNLYTFVAPYLQAFGNSVYAWITANAGGILERLGAWGIAFVEWIAPLIPPVLAQLGVLVGRIWDYIVEQAPGFTQRVLTWAGAFLSWVETDVLPALPGLIFSIGEGIGRLIGAVAPVVGDAAAAIGRHLVESIQSGFAAAWNAFVAYLGRQLAALPQPVLNFLGLDPANFVALNSAGGAAARTPAAALPGGGAATPTANNMGLTLNVIQDRDGRISDIDVTRQEGIQALRVALAGAAGRGR